jgi:hypothetical protein
MRMNLMKEYENLLLNIYIKFLFFEINKFK